MRKETETDEETTKRQAKNISGRRKETEVVNCRDTQSERQRMKTKLRTTRAGREQGLGTWKVAAADQIFVLDGRCQCLGMEDGRIGQPEGYGTTEETT